MKKFCNVQEAAVVLQMSAADLRALLNTGYMNLGKIEKHGKRTVYKIETQRVLEEANLTEWPEDIDISTAAVKAANAAMILKQNGYDVGIIADVLKGAGVISKLQHERMMQVAK